MLRNRRTNYPVDILPLHTYEEKPKFFRGNHRYWILLMVLIVLLGSGGIIYIAVSRTTITSHTDQSDTAKAANSMDDRTATRMDLSDILEAAHSMEHRIMHMQEACLQYLGTDQQSEQFEFHNMLYNRSRKIFYCPSLKTGSTNFIVHFLTLAGIKEKKIRKKAASSLHKKAEAISAHISFLESIGLGRDNSMTKIITVRHPFERLVSAYRTVFERKSTIFSAHQHIAFTIIKNYHNPKFPLSKDRVHPTFDEFVRYLIYKAEVGNNPYWTPYFHYCSPCDVNYNYIIKMETCTRDQHFLLKQIHLDDFLKPQEMNVNPEGRTSMDTVKHYLSKVTSGDLNLLQAKYDADFKLFGYDPYPYMKFATNGEAVPPAEFNIHYSGEHEVDEVDEEDEEERKKKKYDEYKKKENRKRYETTDDNDLKGMHDANIHDDIVQDVKNEYNFFQVISDKKNIFQDKKKHNGFQDTGSKNDVIQNIIGEKNVVQDTAGEHSMVQDKAGEHNMVQDKANEQKTAQKTAGEYVVQDTASEHSMVQDKAGEHNMVQDTATEQKAAQNTAEEYVVQDATSKSNMAQDTASMHNVAQDTAGENNVAQDTASENNVVQDTVGENNVAQGMAGENNVAQDTTGENNVAQDTTGENNVAQNTAGVHNAVEDAAGEHNVAQDTEGQHSVVQDIEGGHNVVEDSSEHMSQDNREQHKTINTDDHNEERKSDEGQNVVQGNTDHQTIHEVLSEKMVKEESSEHKDDNTGTADNVAKYT